MTRAIEVHADWAGLGGPIRVGVVHPRQAGSGSEIFEFAYAPEALQHPVLGNVSLDPRIGLYAGPQYPAGGQPTFGLLADTCPDRWGRLLMKRRHERLIRAGVVPKGTLLQESDFLLGVHDAFRVGGLRFKTSDDGPFLDAQAGVAAAPPFVQLRELEAASRALERDPDNVADEAGEWLRLLLAPGGSLGGARPKASVAHPDGSLWIAKFPSERDTHDVGSWELLVQTLAKNCEIRVPASFAQRFHSAQRTFLVKRFDRTAEGGRLHFASAMTLTGHHDGDDASTGASYLELAEVVIRAGAQTHADLHELWRRIVFNMLVSNTDDHLRNHGFILVPGKGWRLSPAFDMNPVPLSAGLRLNVSASDNALDLELARSVAHLFRLRKPEAEAILERCVFICRQWRAVAQALKISASEQAAMASAFRLAG